MYYFKCNIDFLWYYFRFLFRDDEERSEYKHHVWKQMLDYEHDMDDYKTYMASHSLTLDDWHKNKTEWRTEKHSFKKGGTIKFSGTIEQFQLYDSFFKFVI